MTEINALKRSKKNLGDMDASKMGLDQLRATLNTVRDAMTELKTKIQAIRTQEDGVKAEVACQLRSRALILSSLTTARILLLLI